ncbi:MAG: siderophore-interacting protein [Jatrophihabitantaceae bacterium]
MSAPLVRRSPTHLGQVVAAGGLTARMRRVTVQADSMQNVELRPAQDVELHLVDGSGRRVKRRYTIRQARPELGELDLDVQLHGDGPGAAWGLAAAPGDAISFQGPRGKLQLTAAQWHLLIGDESALPAIASICEALPAGERAIAAIEVQDAADEQPFPHTAQVNWVHRGDIEPGTPEHLVSAVAAHGLPDGQGHAYLLGETRTMVAVRALLESRGLAHDSIFLKGYWNIGRPDRIAGQRPSSR